jgi:DHA1 family inner membrane transport protein
MSTENAAAPAIDPPRPMPWLLIAATCLATFAITASGSTRAPFLVTMSQDLGVSLGAIANLIGMSSIAWGLVSFAAGIGSDLIGRKPFLVGAPIALAVAMTGVGQGQSFLAVAVWATVAGGTCGLFTGVSMAEIAGRVTDRQRGRALGWIMTGQSMTLLIGVPLASWIGASIGWRGVNYCVAGLSLVSALAMVVVTKSVVREGAVRRAAKRPSLRTALTGPVLRLLGSVIAERICFGLSAVYYATFMLQTYDLSLQFLALPLMIFALGNILGTIVGGQLGDRLHDRALTFALALMASGIVAILLFGWQAGIGVSTALGFTFMFTNALSRPSLMAALADVPAEVRGTVLGLNSTAASAGWLGAAAIGGWILATVGFAGFGPFAAVLAILGAILALSGRC